MPKHPHAELMLEYAKDAMETDKPWERWEFNNGAWNCLFKHPSWAEEIEYRRKPKPYEPTLLDQALELEIEAAKLRLKHAISNTKYAQLWEDHVRNLEDSRTHEMSEHLKSQGKL